MRTRSVSFDMFFRKVPDGGGYTIMAGLAQFIEAIDNLSFTEADIEYLRGTHVFNEKFLDYLRSFSFHCNVWAIEGGTPIFPQRPSSPWEGPPPSSASSSRPCCWSPSITSA